MRREKMCVFRQQERNFQASRACYQLFGIKSSSLTRISSTSYFVTTLTIRQESDTAVNGEGEGKSYQSEKVIKRQLVCEDIFSF